MATKIKKNFRTKLHLACGDEKFRPAMQHIVFKDGYALATNAHLLIKQKLELHNFSKDEIKQMEGKTIHKDTFLEIYRYDFVTIENGNFVCKRGNVEAKFELKKPDFKFPNFDEVFPNESEAIPLTEIGIDLKYLNIMLQISCGNDNQMVFKFNRPNKAVLMRNDKLSWEDEMLLVMPFMITN